MKEVKSQDYSHNMFGLSNEVIKDISDVLKKHPNIDKVLIFGEHIDRVGLLFYEK